MGIFSDKLLLKVNAVSTTNGFLKLQIEEAKNTKSHLLSFSCISLIGSQLTVLSYQHPQSLSKKLLMFADNPIIQYEITSLVSGFQLEIYEGRGHNLYNQFSPNLSRSPAGMDNSRLETEIECILQNYVSAVYEKADSRNKSKILKYIKRTVAFYQQELRSKIARINPYDIEQRKKIAKTVVDFSNDLYRKWGET